MTNVELLSRGVAAAWLVLALGTIGVAVASRVVAGPRAAPRLAAACLIALAFATGSFWLLSPWGLFRLAPVLCFTTLAAAAAVASALRGRTARGTGRRLAADARRIARAFDPRAGWSGWVVAAVVVAALVRLFRAAYSPPLGWDGLTYHLFKAGRFIQDGGATPWPAPDVWQAYDYLAPGGEILWAWAMLPLSGDALVPFAEALVWAALALAVYALSRELGGAGATAKLAAVACAALPAAIALIGSAYVDNALAAAAILGLVFVARAWTSPRPRPADLVLAAAGLGLAIGIKTMALPVVAVALPALLAAAVLRPLGRRARWLAAGLAALALGLPAPLRAWVERGSPVWPVPVAIGGHTLLPGLDLVPDETVKPRVAEEPADQAAWMLWRRRRDGAFLGPGLAVPVLAVLAAAALPGLARDRRRRGAAAATLGVAAASAALYLSGPVQELVATVSAATTGRYFLPGLAALAALAGCLPGRCARAALAGAAAVAVVQGWPRGWDLAERSAAAGAGLAAVLVGAGLAGIGWLAARRPGLARRALAALAAVAVVAAGIAALAQIRRTHRAALWEAAARARAPLFHLHRLHPTYAAAWPLWAAVDGPRPLTLAVVAGWDGLGHNGFYFPLLGSRLQNRVLYVPPAASGELVDAADPVALSREASFPAWWRRLDEADVDAVVSLAPRWTFEDGWMRAAPDRFLPCGVSRGGLHAIFCRDRALARELAPAGPTGAEETTPLSEESDAG